MNFAFEVDSTSMEHLFELRLALEPLAASLAAERADEDELERLKALVERASSRRLCRKQRLELDGEFHRLVVMATRNPLLIAFYRALAVMFRQSCEITSRAPTPVHETIAEYRQLLAALERRDAQAATAAMERHLGRVRTDARSPALTATSSATAAAAPDSPPRDRRSRSC